VSDAPSDIHRDMATIERIARKTREARIWFTAPTREMCEARGLGLSRPNAAHLSRLADAWRDHPLCKGWSAYVVGSALDGDGTANDLDIRIAAGPGSRRTLNALERVMIWLQWYGLYRLGVRIDPAHHQQADIEAAAASNPDFVYTSWVLESPRHRDAIETPHGGPLRCRRAGGHLVACRGPFSARPFFLKLPAGPNRLRMSSALDAWAHAKR